METVLGKQDSNKKERVRGARGGLGTRESNIGREKDRESERERERKRKREGERKRERERDIK